MKKSTALAVCSVSAALSVLILFLGGITAVLAYAAPMLVGLLMIMLRRTFSQKSAWITYIAVSLLSIFLVTDRECALMYISFFGYYPIIRHNLKKIKPKALRVITELFIFNAAMILCQLALIYIFGIQFLEEGQGKWFIAAFAVMMNVLFVLYDFLIGNVEKIYSLKIEKRIKKNI